LVTLLKGAEAAKAISAKLQENAARLKAQGVIPCLAILRLGTREDDLSYERGAIKRCETVGVAVRTVTLPEDVPQTVLIGEIQRLNQDAGIHGILLFRPLPAGLDDGAVRQAILPAKDVDGVTDGSLAAVYSGSGGGYPPCTAQACVELLKHYQIPLKGKRAVVVGRSLVIGKPVSMLLLAEHATVTICHSRSENLPEICREADILVVAAGKAGMVGGESVRPGQIVLDVGIHADAAGKLCGDVRFDEAAAVAEAITPVPGGVGSVTTAILVSHVIEAAQGLATDSGKPGAAL
jgi:methylenetetrahydrofolate dehydrogenase (NADP+)/methenyltetrahydrofolate cyclohydrolase